MKERTKYTICLQGADKNIFSNGFFVSKENYKNHFIPGLIGAEFIAFYDQKFNEVILINRNKIIWIRKYSGIRVR